MIYLNQSLFRKNLKLFICFFFYSIFIFLEYREFIDCLNSLLHNLVFTYILQEVQDYKDDFGFKYENDYYFHPFNLCLLLGCGVIDASAGYPDSGFHFENKGICSFIFFTLFILFNFKGV